MKAVCVLTLVVALAGAAAPAHGGCDPADLKASAGAAIIYDGVIGDQPARLALVFEKNGGVEGRYALASSRADILVRGRLEPASGRMTLTEVDARGQPGAALAAILSNPAAASEAMPSGAKPGFIYSPDAKARAAAAPYPPAPPFTDCDFIGGSMQAPGGASQAIRLNKTRALEHPQFGHLYAIAGVADDETVNRRAQSFREAIAANRREDVVKHFRFPIAFTVGGKFVVIENQRDLLARYDEIFTPGVRNTLARLVPRLMQATETGIVLAFGIWLDQEGYIIAF